jgi:hypothetical protein
LHENTILLVCFVGILVTALVIKLAPLVAARFLGRRDDRT